MSPAQHLDGGLTLVIERHLPAPRAAVWRCWTEGDLLAQWFCPKPWRVAEADLLPHPGGRMNVVMAGPEGERVDCIGCYLSVEPGRRLEMTDSFSEGFRPRSEAFVTTFVELGDAEDGGTLMRWGARHATAESVERHLQMGFEPGWNAAADQLAELAAGLDNPTLPRCLPSLRTCLFLADQVEEAARFYVELLPDSRIDGVFRPMPDTPVLAVEFVLGGQPMLGLNGNPQADSATRLSLSVMTADQAQTDALWHQLCANGGSELPCGWLKDRFGIHWQIVPEALPQLMASGDPAAIQRVSAALMGMTRIDIAALRAAHEGR